MYEGETIVCEGVVCEEIVKQFAYGCERVVCEKVACKRVVCERVTCAKILCVCKKAGLPSDTVESTTGRPAITRMRTDRPVPLCVPSKAH